MTGLGLLADVAANTEKILNFLEGVDGEEEDGRLSGRSSSNRIREARELIERERRLMREQREAEERRKAG